jgi:hypothetical protein
MNKLVSGIMAVAAGAALAIAVPAKANADPQWGAMAYSLSTNSAGWGTGPTLEAAQGAANNQCAANANDCTAAGDIQGGCVAVVSNSQGWAFGTGLTRDAAIKDANTHAPAATQVVLAQCVPGA